jgi:N-acetylmuramoyl-L-alanine amidase
VFTLDDSPSPPELFAVAYHAHSTGRKRKVRKLSKRHTAVLLLAAACAAAAALVSNGEQGSAARTPIVVVDPGHDLYGNSALEPIGPGSSTRKIKDGGGARGVVSGKPEAVINLAVSKRLATLLRNAGIRVVMTRTTTSGVSMGNVDRAQIANRLHAALLIRVHCDGSSSSRDNGTHTLYPAYIRGWTSDIYRPSLKLARLVQSELVKALGFPDRGLNPRSDITGFNWADVPVILPELGFLTYPAEDRALNSAAGQDKAALGMCRGILRFLKRSPASCE